MAEIRLSEFYDPQAHQIEFHHARKEYRYRLQTGGAGSGKSLALLWEAITLGLMYPGAQLLLLRKTYPDLEKGLIRDLFSSVPRDIYKWNDQKHFATLSSGSIVFFGHAEQGEKALAEYLSSAFVFIGWDELGQFSYEAWDFMSSRNRVNLGCKPDANGRMPFTGMAGATNPMGPGWAWIKSLFVDRRPIAQMGKAPRYNPQDYMFVHSTVLNNKYQLERDPRYVENLRNMSPDQRKIFYEGDMNSPAGAYYSNFLHDLHVIDLRTDPNRVEWQRWQPSWIGFDWGLAHFAAALWFTKALVRRIDGTRKLVIVCYREMVVNETDIDDVAKLIKECSIGAPAYDNPAQEIGKLAHFFTSHELFARKTSPRPDQTVAAQLSRVLQSLKLPACQKASGSASHQERVDGATLLRNHLTAGELFFTSNCEQLIRTIPLLARDEKDKEDVAKTSGMEDDLFDALKHGTLSVLRGEPRPAEDIVRERGQEINDPLMRWQYLTKNLPGTQPVRRFTPNVKMPWEI